MKKTNFKEGDEIYFITGSTKPSGVPMPVVTKGVFAYMEDSINTFRANTLTIFILNSIVSRNIYKHIPSERDTKIEYIKCIYNRRKIMTTFYRLCYIDFKSNNTNTWYRTSSPTPLIHDDKESICNVAYYIRMVIDIYQDDCNKFNMGYYNIKREQCFNNLVKEFFI